VTFGLGVYDITKFIPEHPGAKKNIMLGAGSSIEPFWHTYQFHKQPYILKMLEKYRIGNLKAEDRASVENQGDPYANEPKRNPILMPRAATPFNAEPPLSVLVENFITPVEYFYGEKNQQFFKNLKISN
jgi:sulfite oxidase